MRKTLLIAAAALAASVISSQAQVYSQNIVGYVNVTVPNGYTCIATPLVANGGNIATNVFDCFSGNNDGSTLLLWNGVKYVTYVFNSGSATGFKNASGTSSLPAPDLSPGIGYFFNNQNDPVLGGGSVSNITFVGDVLVNIAATGSQTVGTTTNLISGAGTLQFLASKLPIGGGVASVLGITNDPAGDMDGTVVLVPSITSGGIHGYVQSVYKSTSSTGFKNQAGTAEVPQPIIPVATGFLINNQSGADYIWTQSL